MDGGVVLLGPAPLCRVRRRIDGGRRKRGVRVRVRGCHRTLNLHHVMRGEGDGRSARARGACRDLRTRWHRVERWLFRLRCLQSVLTLRDCERRELWRLVQRRAAELLLLHRSLILVRTEREVGGRRMCRVRRILVIRSYM